MREVFVAAEVIRRSLKEAFVAVRRAVRNIGKEVSAATGAAWPPTKTLKRSVGRASGRLAA
jgi:hypothetical protein